MGRNDRTPRALRLRAHPFLCALAQHGLITVAIQLKALAFGVKKKELHIVLISTPPAVELFPTLNERD
jgi:hypothetical protein